MIFMKPDDLVSLNLSKASSRRYEGAPTPKRQTELALPVKNHSYNKSLPPEGKGKQGRRKTYLLIV